MTAAVIDPITPELARLAPRGDSSCRVDVYTSARSGRVAFFGYKPEGSPALAFVAACLAVVVVAVVVTA